MDVGIKFPSDDEVIREDVARFRALSSAERLSSIRSLLSAGLWMMTKSSKPQFIRNYTEDLERRARDAFMEFVARHGNRDEVAV